MAPAFLIPHHAHGMRKRGPIAKAHSISLVPVKSASRPILSQCGRIVQIPIPPLPPRFVPPPFHFSDFLWLYDVALELLLSVLPRKIRKPIMETLFPLLRLLLLWTHSS
jgi:hypothetical protein